MSGKTSTFIIHHDQCRPFDQWTAHVLQALQRFLETGDTQAAAALSMVGLQLVTSEHHVPKGGTMQPVGFVKPAWAVCEATDDIAEIRDGGDGIFRVCRVYVGPEEYVVPIPIAGGEGYVEDWDYKHFDDREAAEAYLKQSWETDDADG